MTELSSPKISPLPNQLRAWAGTYKSHGRSEEFNLLYRAAELIERGQHETHISVELSVFSIIAEDKGQTGWAGVLKAASDALALTNGDGK